MEDFLFDPSAFNVDSSTELPTNKKPTNTKRYDKKNKTKYNNSSKIFSTTEELPVLNDSKFIRTEAQMKAQELKAQGNVNKQKQKRIIEEAKKNKTNVYYADGKGGWNKTHKSNISPSSVQYASDFGPIKPRNGFETMSAHMAQSGSNIDVSLPTGTSTSMFKGDMPNVKGDWDKAERAVERKMRKTVTPDKLKLSNAKYYDEAGKAIENAAEKAAKKSGGLVKSIAKSAPMKVIAGASVASLIIGNMVRSKGQQSNSELYGQRMPYM